MKFLHMIFNLFKRKNIIPQDIRGTTITDKDIVAEIIKEVSTPPNQKALKNNKDACDLIKKLQK